jgi:hypothetical protein
MGWASGSGLFSDVIRILQKSVKEESVRKKIYKELISAFEDMDCDTLDECVEKDNAFDDVWEWLHPDDEYTDEEDAEIKREESK